LSSVQSIINICIAAQQNPVIEKIMASIIQSFVTVRRSEEMELHQQQLSSFCLAEYTKCQKH